MKFIKLAAIVISIMVWASIFILSFNKTFPNKFISLFSIERNISSLDLTFSSILNEGNFFYPKFVISDLKISSGSQLIASATEITLGISLLESITNMQPTIFYFSGENIALDLNNFNSDKRTAPPFLFSENTFLDIDLKIITSKDSQTINIDFLRASEFTTTTIEQKSNITSNKNVISFYQDTQRDSLLGNFDITDSNLINALNKNVAKIINFKFNTRGRFSIQNDIGRTDLSLNIYPLERKMAFDPLSIELIGIYENQNLYLYKGKQIPTEDTFFGRVDLTANSVFFNSLAVNNFRINTEATTSNLVFKNILFSKIGNPEFYIGSNLEIVSLKDLYFRNIKNINGNVIYRNGLLQFQSINNPIIIDDFVGEEKTYNVDLIGSYDQESIFVKSAFSNNDLNFFLEYSSGSNSNQTLAIKGENLTLFDIQGLISSEFIEVSSFLDDLDDLLINKIEVLIYPKDKGRNIARANVSAINYKDNLFIVRDALVEIDFDNAYIHSKYLLANDIELDEFRGMFNFASRDLYFIESSKHALNFNNYLLDTKSVSKGRYNLKKGGFYSVTLLNDFKFSFGEGIIKKGLFSSDKIRINNAQDFFAEGEFFLDDFNFSSPIFGNINNSKLDLNFIFPINAKVLESYNLDQFLLGSANASALLSIVNNEPTIKIYSNLKGLGLKTPIDIFSKKRDEQGIFNLEFYKISNGSWNSAIKFNNYNLMLEFLENDSFFLSKLSLAGPNLNVALTKDSSGFFKASIKNSKFDIIQNNIDSKFSMRSISNINSRIELANVAINNILINKADFYFQKNSKAMSLNKVFLESDSFSITPYNSKDAYFSYRFDSNLFHINGIYEFQNPNSLSILNYKDLKFDFLRLKSNMQFKNIKNLQNAEGDLSILGKGLQFKNVQGGSALNLIGIFNLKRFIGKIVNLDLSIDEYSSTELRRVEGAFKFNKDLGRILDTLYVDTNATKMAWEGFIYKNDGKLNDLDLDLNLRIRLQENLPWYAGIIAGIPGIAGSYLFNEVFESELENLSNYKFKVSGDINNPLIKSVKN